MAMRNDNQQTKKKFRLPLFDIALLLLLAIAVAGGSYWVSRRGDKETVTVQYTIRFENVDNAYSGAVTQAEELFSVSGTRMGEVKSARVTRSVEKTFDLHTSYEESGEYLVRRGFRASLSCRERTNLITRDPACLFRLGRYNRPSGMSTAEFMERIL